jgi:TonB family protein
MIRWMIISTLATGLFYALYLWLFRRDRWFELSRAYLFIIIGFCSLFPWFRLPASMMSSTPATEFLMTVDIPEPYVVGSAPMEEPELSLKLDIIPMIYLGGVALMMAILIIQLTAQAVRIRRLRREYPVYGWGNGFAIPKGALLILVPDNTEPYSFFKNIIVGTRDLDEEEMRCILAHESEHVSRNHSLDIVCMRWVCCVMWFNPFAWMMLHELRAVHEYQADAAVADGDNKDYLRLLYRQTLGTGYGHITNNFQSINIKKRIVMMNKTKSRFGAWKVLAAFPVAALLMMVGCKPAAPEIADSEEQAVVEPQATVEPELFDPQTAPEGFIPPEYPNGTNALYKYLAENIHYPEQAKADSIEGKVFVRFIVRDNGDIVNVEVERGIGGGCDEEAMRVIKSMPKWIPATSEGKLVNVQYVIPINFKLQ